MNMYRCATVVQFEINGVQSGKDIKYIEVCGDSFIDVCRYLARVLPSYQQLQAIELIKEEV